MARVTVTAALVRPGRGCNWASRKAPAPHFVVARAALWTSRLAPAEKIATEEAHISMELPLSDISYPDAIEAIYTSIRNDNEDIDTHIAALKGAMHREGIKQATFETARLAQPNRQGRKLMQAYFRKKGVAVDFT